MSVGTFRVNLLDDVLSSDNFDFTGIIFTFADIPDTIGEPVMDNTSCKDVETLVDIAVGGRSNEASLSFGKITIVGLDIESFDVLLFVGCTRDGATEIDFDTALFNDNKVGFDFIIF